MATELEQRIQSLEIQIRVLSKSIAKAKNGTRKAADVVTLATLQGELDNLKSKQDVEHGTVEAVTGD
jgi:predicted  nucleic acid-binding Zn-ribbon protein